MISPVKASNPLAALILSSPEDTALDPRIRSILEELGNRAFGCDLSPIDFAAFAESCGAKGLRCKKPQELAEAMSQFLDCDGPAVLEATVDADEKPAIPDELRA